MSKPSCLSFNSFAGHQILDPLLPAVHLSHDTETTRSSYAVLDTVTLPPTPSLSRLIRRPPAPAQWPHRQWWQLRVPRSPLGPRQAEPVLEVWEKPDRG